MSAFSRQSARLRTMLSAALVMSAASVPAALAVAQSAPPDDEAETEAPPTTLPFEPTVQSAPPARPTYPEGQAQPSVPVTPPDTLCTEIGPIVRAGIAANRFAALSPSTEGGAVLGTYDTGGGIAEIGGDYCTVLVPAASSQTAGSPYNQVTCQLALEHGESPYLDDMRERRNDIAGRIGACPAVSEWTGTRPGQTPLSTGDITEDHVFTHPDVNLEIIVRASHHEMTGQWPAGHVRTLSLIFRTPNPDRAASAESASTLP